MTERASYEGDIEENWVGGGPYDSWRISNFKSIGSVSADCQGGHITVLTGSNSIGKSSFIQSLLMLCQSVNYGRRVLLNGPLVSLGKPIDVIRTGTDCLHIEMGFIHHYIMPKVTAIPVKSELSLRIDNNNANAIDSEALTIDRIAFKGDKGFSFTLVKAKCTSKDYQHCMEYLPEGEEQDLSVFRVTPSGEKTLYRSYAIFRGFEPVMVIRFRTKQESYRAYRDELMEYFYETKAPTLNAYMYRRIEDEFYEMGYKVNVDWRGRNRVEVLNSFSKLSDREQDQLIRNVAETLSRNVIALCRNIENEVMLNRPASDWVVRLDKTIKNNHFDYLSLLLITYAATIKRFVDRLQYIGPLRDDPRVVSALDEVASPNLPIGMKGERAPSLLLTEQGTSGTFGLPDASAPTKVSFEQALDAWARYLGIADSVRAENLAKYGVGLSVTSDSLADGDLTMVGVGASQVIPIILGVLSAPHSSILLIEQPELHLHPSAQSRLADFFLYARPDLSYIVESHSEALVTRLRRRVVEESSLASRISILFLERHGFGQGVISRQLAIDEYGNLDEWPIGFMDAVQDDTRCIMKAAIAKRRQKGGLGDA